MESTTTLLATIRPYVYKDRGINVAGRAMWHLSNIARNAGYGDSGMPRVVHQATLGIAWAIETGRLPGAAEVAIRSLTGLGMAKLVAEVATNCASMAETPRYLISKYVA